MKKLIFALLVLSGMNIQAQKKVERETAYSNESVEMNLEFASSIKIVTWDKQKIKVEASIASEKKEIIENYELNLRLKDSAIEFSSNSKELFKIEEERGIHFHDFKHEFIYTVYVPKDVKLKVSSITGKLTADYLRGDISIDLVVGDIVIKEFDGDLNLKTVSGEIHLPVKDSSFSASSLMGEIYADANPKIQKKNGIIGRKMNLELAETNNRLSLDTVTGDIYLK
ncbi:hypothetical protein [Salinimicrobium soli]|uniref:hypothetical protein n=1 Tax=Salinimicrobium soli TaxID=1254399 RepID=UPI003AADB6D3